MPMVDRAQLLQRLTAIEPGTSARDSIPQTSCFALYAGWAYTFNQEIACAVATGLDKAIAGAVPAKQLLGLLGASRQATLNISSTVTALIIDGTDERSRIPLEEIKLPFDKVERPQAWQPLSPSFGEAVDLVQKCTVKVIERREEFAKTCVHVCPGWLEASDNVHAARYVLDTFVSTPSLVRGTTLKEVAPLGFTQGCETEKWLHFRNALGLRLSIKKFEPEQYPDLGRFLQIRGDRVVFPKTLRDVALRAGLFADAETDGKLVTVRLTNTEVVIQSSGVRGDHIGKRLEVEYGGTAVNFRVSAKLLADLTQTQGDIEISPVSLRVANGPYTYLTSIGQVE